MDYEKQAAAQRMVQQLRQSDEQSRVLGGQVGGGGLVGAVAQSVAPDLCETLSETEKVLQEALSRVQHAADRLFGPQPLNDGRGDVKSAEAPSVQDRTHRILGTARDLLAATARLNRIG